MSSKQLDNFTINNVRLTYAEIFRDDQFGEWSFKEIGYRLEKGHPDYVEGGLNFDLIEIPRELRNDKTWEATKALLLKGKTSEQIQKILNFIENQEYLKRLFNDIHKSKLG